MLLITKFRPANEIVASIAGNFSWNTCLAFSDVERRLFKLKFLTAGLIDMSAISTSTSFQGNPDRIFLSTDVVPSAATFFTFSTSPIISIDLVPT